MNFQANFLTQGDRIFSPSFFFFFFSKIWCRIYWFLKDMPQCIQTNHGQLDNMLDSAQQRNPTSSTVRIWNKDKLVCLLLSILPLTEGIYINIFYFILLLFIFFPLLSQFLSYPSSLFFLCFFIPFYFQIWLRSPTSGRRCGNGRSGHW